MVYAEIEYYAAIENEVYKESSVTWEDKSALKKRKFQMSYI